MVSKLCRKFHHFINFLIQQKLKEGMYQNHMFNMENSNLNMRLNSKNIMEANKYSTQTQKHLNLEEEELSLEQIKKKS